MQVEDSIEAPPLFFSPVHVAGLEKLQTIITKLKRHYKERDDLSEICALALLCKQHVIVYGPPGEAKSAIIEDFCSAITGFTYYSTQLFKSTAPDEVFGHYALSEFKQDRLVRVTTGKIPEAHIAYVDEFFNASSSLLNAFLSIMNERVFQGKQCPLQTMYSSTNFEPDEPELVAVIDRFLYRLFVDRVQGRSNFAALLDVDGRVYFSDEECIDAKTITALQQKVREVDFTPVKDKLILLWDVLRRDGIDVSDRRYLWSVRALQASALLDSRDQVNDSDLLILQHILWTDRSQKPTILDNIFKIIEPVMAKVNKLYNQALNIENELRILEPTSFYYTKTLKEKIFKLGDIIKQVRRIQNTHVVTPKVTGVIKDLVKAISENKRYYEKCLGNTK